MTERPFRFGLVAGRMSGARQWAELVRRAEALGFDTLLVPDVVGGPAPMIAATAAAAATKSLRVGSYVLVAALRRPRMLAWEASTLHRLSGGRFELGLGAGRPTSLRDAETLGVPLGSPGDRVRAVADTITAVRALEADLRPPILVAASGPRMSALAARDADIVALGLPPMATEPHLADAVDRVRLATRDRPERPELALNLLHAGGGDPPAWLKQAIGIDAQVLADTGAVSVLAGSASEMAGTLRSRRARFGVSYVTAGAHLAEILAPVVELLRGA